MARGVKGSGKTKAPAPAPAPAPEKRKRGGAKGPRRPAAVRLNEVREKYEAYKANATEQMKKMEQRIAVLETAVAREEDVVSIRKRYLEKSEEEINREYQEALKKIAEIKKIRKG